MGAIPQKSNLARLISARGTNAYVDLADVVLTTEAGDKLGYDTSTNALEGIDYEHHEIHAGSAYDVGWYDADLGIGDELIIAFKTSATAKEMHMVITANNSSASIFETLEGPTITAGTGTNLTIRNMNRNSLNASLATNMAVTPVAGLATLNPTITADGTVLNTELIGAGVNKGGGASRGTTERILKANTIYAFRLTGTAASGKANLHLDWYEHTPKA